MKSTKAGPGDASFDYLVKQNLIKPTPEQIASSNPGYIASGLGFVAKEVGDTTAVFTSNPELIILLPAMVYIVYLLIKYMK